MTQEFFKTKDLTTLFCGEVTIGKYGIFVDVKDNQSELEHIRELIQLNEELK